MRGDSGRLSAIFASLALVGCVVGAEPPVEEGTAESRQALNGIPYWEGLSAQPERARNISRAYAEKYINSGKTLGTDLKRGLRMIAAVFNVYRHAGDYPGDFLTRLGSLSEFQANALSFVRTYVKATADVGTGRDYDLDLNEEMALLQNFIYAYEYGTNAPLLTKDLVWEFICQDGGFGGCVDNGTGNPGGVASFSGQGLLKKTSSTIFGPFTETYTETENHVLAVHSWRYLINDYVRFIASGYAPTELYDPRVVHLYNLKDGSGVAHYNNLAGNMPVRDWLLQAMGRPLHNGMFEENARPYAAISWQAISNVRLGAGRYYMGEGSDTPVQEASRNALDFLSALYAFQSFEGKRLSPMRRQYDYRRRIGMGNNDYMMDIMAMLSGAYVFADKWDDTRTNPDGTYVSRYSHANINGAQLDKAQGYALWAALLGDWDKYPNYQLPAPIADFMHDKHGGYTTRVMTHFGTSHYAKDKDAIYFTGPTTAYKGGTLNSSPEFYFTTNDYVNSSGGYSRQFFSRIPGVQETNEYNWNSVPQTLLTRGDIGRYWGATGEDKAKMNLEILNMVGNVSVPHESKNLWTYKNFAYGYIHNDSGTDYHVTWPQNVPPSWGSPAIPQFGINSRGQFRIYDLRNVEVGKGTPAGTKYGFYVILGLVSKSNLSDGQLYEYGRGFWEIVPGNLFADANALKAKVIASNPASHFTNNTSEHYFYRLAVSGDKLQLDRKMGASVSCQGIMAIWDHNNTALSLDSELSNNCSETSLRAMPILEVRAVDHAYRYTGVKYVEAPGNGMVTIRNPHIGMDLVLNSNNYTNASREEIYY